MKKIKEFLERNSYEVKFKNAYSRQQYRSRYNCDEEVYKITKDSKEYVLTVKITGRKLYMMEEKDSKSNKLIAGGESQIRFIENLERYIKNEVI